MSGSGLCIFRTDPFDMAWIGPHLQKEDSKGCTAVSRAGLVPVLQNLHGHGR